MEMNDLMNFVMPLPSPDNLRRSKEIAFLENVKPHGNHGANFYEDLSKITEFARKKNFNSYREYCTHAHELESAFLSLLQYMAKAQPRANDVLVIVGGSWKTAQFQILTDLCPGLNIDLWCCRIQGAERLPEGVQRKFGFPSASSYEELTHLHLFSDVRSTNSSKIMDDLAVQIKIVESCRPLTSSVRFRPPFRKDSKTDSVNYFVGEMQTICYAPPTNTATRIFLRNGVSEDAEREDLGEVSLPEMHFESDCGESLIECREGSDSRELREDAPSWAENGYPSPRERHNDELVKGQYNLLLMEQTLNYYNTEVRSVKRWRYKDTEGSFDDCYRTLILERVLEAYNLESDEQAIAVFWQRVIDACEGNTVPL